MLKRVKILVPIVTKVQLPEVAMTIERSVFDWRLLGWESERGEWETISCWWAALIAGVTLRSASGQLPA